MMFMTEIGKKIIFLCKDCNTNCAKQKKKQIPKGTVEIITSYS